MNPQTPSPAEVYDELFVPALFRQWDNLVAAAAERTGLSGAVSGRMAGAVCGALDHSPGYAVRIRSAGTSVPATTPPPPGDSWTTR